MRSVKNRDGNLPTFSTDSDLIEPDKPKLSVNIAKADEIIRQGLQQYLEFAEEDLGTYLSYIVIQHLEPFVDEYGQVIRSYKKIFRFIWEQYNETLVQNYAVGQFDKDKLDLCSVARFLSHQEKVNNRRVIMKEMSDALNYTCHPCTPYKRKEHGETIVPSTGDINKKGITPEESLILCKEYQNQDQLIIPDWSITPGTNV